MESLKDLQSQGSGVATNCSMISSHTHAVPMCNRSFVDGPASVVWLCNAGSIEQIGWEGHSWSFVMQGFGICIYRSILRCLAPIASPYMASRQVCMCACIIRDVPAIMNQGFKQVHDKCVWLRVVLPE